MEMDEQVDFLSILNWCNSPIDIKYKDRISYYKAFDKYHTHGDLNQITKLFAKYLLERLKIYNNILNNWIYLISLNIYQTYTVSFFKLIKNSFLVFISQLPIACLSLIFSILPLVVVYFFNITLMNFIAWLIYICLGFGHSVLTIVIFNLYMLDESVNKRQFKEIYRKGLFDSSNDVVVDEGFKNDAQDLWFIFWISGWR